LLKYQYWVERGDISINQKVYKNTLYKIVREGGDTDTNACIACGMIGALVGVKNIPKEMLQKLFMFDCTKEQIVRPDMFSVRSHVVKNILKIVENRPRKDVDIVNNIFEKPN